MDAIREQRAGGGTALNDAICMASEKLQHPPLPKGAESDVRRVIVVISDGHDNLSDHALSEAIDAAIRSEAAIYRGQHQHRLARDRRAEPAQQVPSSNAATKFWSNSPIRPAGGLSSRTASTTSRNRFSISEPNCAASISSPIRRRDPPPRGQYRKIEVQTDSQGPDRPHAQGLLRGRPDCRRSITPVVKNHRLHRGSRRSGAEIPQASPLHPIFARPAADRRENRAAPPSELPVARIAPNIRALSDYPARSIPCARGSSCPARCTSTLILRNVPSRFGFGRIVAKHVLRAQLL